jgi:hypothetical protein
MNSFGQGRVVINEYMPWVGNGCGATSEFVELFNFGPGPVNIGCYILTDGDYSITIPPNTILEPGKFYLISGQDIISTGCANIDSAVHANLNWNTCNCTSAPIPQDGEGLFTDNGSGSEQIVLLGPNLEVVDAAVRNTSTLETSSLITTSSLSGGCGQKTFDLDLMNISYETIGESAGRSNSFARIIDGDCDWVKETSQSANATNNRQGESASASYELTIVNIRDCDITHGSISINVVTSNFTDIFPMNYILAYDADSNNVFTITDEYTYGTDNTSPRIEIGNLKAGKYRITLSTALGCNLKTLDFDILTCIAPLDLQVLSFKHLKTQQGRQSFEWTISEAETVHTMALEQSIDNRLFSTATEQTVDHNKQGIQTFKTTIPASAHKYFRLRITLDNGSTVFSPTITTNTSVTIPVSRLWPNPTKSSITIETGTLLPSSVNYKIYNLQNSQVDQGSLHIDNYQYSFTLPVHRLPKGLYQLFVFTADNLKPISFRFVKE